MSFLSKISNEQRIGLIAGKLQKGKILRFIETHNALSALIAGDTKINIEEAGEKQTLEFDGFWESSFTDSASKGLPDAEIVSLDSRLATINQIMDVNDKQMIVDGDTGGEASQFEFMVERLEKAGVSMVIIEDKVFPKRNSLEKGSRQTLEDPNVFAQKIERGQAVKHNKGFLIVARIESLIAGLGLQDAIERAKLYLQAGADGIMIHSKKESADDILDFAKAFNEFPDDLTKGKVLCCVPTTYNTIREEELIKAGFNVVIYANHLLRASYLAMERVAEEILKRGRSFEASAFCASVKDVFKKVGFLKLKEKDKEMAEKFGSKTRVLIPAAGRDKFSEECGMPKALMDINGKTILERQVKALNNVGLDKITVIKGYKQELFEMENIDYCVNQDFEVGHVLTSLFSAEKYMNSPCLVIYSDILFQESIIRDLLKATEDDSDADIILVADSSFEYHKARHERESDLIRSKSKIKDDIRKVIYKLDEEVAFIGKKVDKALAEYEFVGIAYFSQKGIETLKQMYDDSQKKYGLERFHEADSFNKASLTDILQEIIYRGYKVKLLKVHKGWMEIENNEDLELAKQVFQNGSNK